MPRSNRSLGNAADGSEPRGRTLRSIVAKPIDRGRPPVYTLTALFLPLVLLYGPFWLRPHSPTIAVMTGLALVPVTLLSIFISGLALRRHERWRWIGLLVLVLNLAVFYLVVLRR